MRPPARVGSKFLLSGLLHCGVCGGPFSIQGARSGKLEAVEGELADVRKRLSRLYEALETSDLTMEVPSSPRIYAMRHREEQLLAAQEDLSRQLENRRVDLPSTEEIKGYVADFREFLQQGTIPERKALIRNFVHEIEVVGDQATLTYTIPMPSDGVMKEETSVLYFANSALPNDTVLRTPSPNSTSASSPPRSGLSWGVGIV